METAFRTLLKIEAWWLRRFSFPAGGSVIALGRKRDVSAESR
jgi:hypothetical protein